jgi:hypothetical protein
MNAGIFNSRLMSENELLLLIISGPNFTLQRTAYGRR